MSNQLFTDIGEGALDGFGRVVTQESTLMHREKVASAAALWGDLLSGGAPMWHMQEALFPRSPEAVAIVNRKYPGLFTIDESQTRSDFPQLTGDVLNRMLLAGWQDFPSPWRQFAKVVTGIRDFREVKRIGADGMEGTWGAQEEGENLTYGAMTETPYTYAPKKYSKGTKFSFEQLMNDDLSAFTDIPTRLARGGNRTISKFATSLYMDANGPHAGFFTGGNDNIVTGNPPLDINSLGAAFNQLAGRTDTEGEPIIIEHAVLVIPPSMRVLANNIMNQTSIDVNVEGGTADQRVRVNNWIVGNMELVEDPYMPIVATTNGNTSWALFASPSVGRPAIEVGFLTGFETPQLYQKVSNTMRAGGAPDQMAGDFSTMSTEYKGVVAFGGTTLDPRGAIASNGTNV